MYHDPVVDWTISYIPQQVRRYRAYQNLLLSKTKPFAIRIITTFEVMVENYLAQYQHPSTER